VGIDQQSAATVRRGETYGGQSRREREADRRDRIMAAGLQLFAERDYDDVTVADICALAKISKRYFYEDFADREELLLAVHRQQNDWLVGGMAAAVPRQVSDVEDVLRPAMGALVRMLSEHPDRGRVIYINAPRMELRRRGLMRKDAEVVGRLVRRAVPKPRDKVLFERMMLGLTAGVTEIIIDWLFGGMPGNREVLIDHLTRLGLAMVREAS
jgi:AcrR family transcriptional regulator